MNHFQKIFNRELITDGRKGKAFPVTFTWRLTEMLDLMKANRLFPSMQKQFISRVIYFYFLSIIYLFSKYFK